MAHPDERIGSILADIARDQGLSERELSRLSGVPHSTLRAGLAGRRPFRLDDFLATCQALGAQPATVLAQAESSAA